MNKPFVAWLNGSSVAVCATADQAEVRAREIFATSDFQRWGMPDGVCKLRITKGARQTIIKEVTIW